MWARNGLKSEYLEITITNSDMLSKLLDIPNNLSVSIEIAECWLKMNDSNAR